MVSKGLFYRINLRALRVLRGYLCIFLLIASLTQPKPIKAATIFKSPDDLEQMIEQDQGDLLIIDIRPRTHFEKKSIISSINIPGILLKNKKFLQKKKLVLIDEGIDYCTVQNLAQNLIDDGFSHVYALEGGIRYFQHKNKRLQITQDSLELRYGLDVPSLQKVLHCKDQSPLLIDIRDKESFEKDKIEGSLWFDYTLDEKVGKKDALENETENLYQFITKALKNKMKQSKTNSSGTENSNLKDLTDDTKHPVILLDTKGEDTPRLARILSRRGINAFYLIDGMESWDLYTKEIPEARKREYQEKDSECEECKR